MNKKLLATLMGTMIIITACVGCNSSDDVIVDEEIINSGDVIVQESTDKIVEINEETFPDEVFRQYIFDKFDNNNDEQLDKSEIIGANQIRLFGVQTGFEGDNYYPGIQSLKGIEYLSELDSLNVECEDISEIDLSNNTQLDYLTLVGTKLTSIDISNNKKLIDRVNNETDVASIDEIDLGNDYTTISVMYAYYLDEDKKTHSPILEYDNGVELITGDYVLEPELIDNTSEEDEEEVSNETSSDGSEGLIPGTDNDTEQTYIYESEEEGSEFEKDYETE